VCLPGTNPSSKTAPTLRLRTQRSNFPSGSATRILAVSDSWSGVALVVRCVSTPPVSAVFRLIPRSQHQPARSLLSSEMRRTLRRSCAACAKSKHSCDLGTPRCSRCTKRKVQCVYANEPLTAALSPSDESAPSGPLAAYRFPPVDPFESYPSTRLPRAHVQRLIHSCMCTLDSSQGPRLETQTHSRLQFSTKSLSNTTLSTSTQPQTPFSSLGGQ
jgi:hypothetical protein